MVFWTSIRVENQIVLLLAAQHALSLGGLAVKDVSRLMYVLRIPLLIADILL